MLGNLCGMLHATESRSADNVFLSEFSSVMRLREACPVCRKANGFWRKRLGSAVALFVCSLLLVVYSLFLEGIVSFFRSGWVGYLPSPFLTLLSLALLRGFIDSSIQYKKRMATDACWDAYRIARRQGWVGREEIERLMLYFREEAVTDWGGSSFPAGKVGSYITASMSILAAALSCLGAAKFGVWDFLDVFSIWILSALSILFVILTVCCSIDFIWKSNDRNIRTMQAAVALRCVMVAPDSLLEKWDREILSGQSDRAASLDDCALGFNAGSGSEEASS